MNTNWLRERRKLLGLTQEDIIARLQMEGIDFSHSSISHWENGRYNPPFENPHFRQALASVLKMSVTEMLSVAGYEIREDTGYSLEARRAAEIIEQLPQEQKQLALGILEQFLSRAV